MNAPAPKRDAVSGVDAEVKELAERSQLTEEQKKLIASLPENKPATRRYVMRKVAWLGNLVWESNGDVFRNHLEAIRKLNARVDALEARDAASLADAYKGTWLPGEYERGSLITHDGSLWLAIEKSARGSKPGGSDAWKLVVKGTR